MLEKWIKWKPVRGLAPKYSIEVISDTPGDFTILLSEYKNQKNKVKVIFKNSVHAYMRADETYRVDLI